MVDPFPPAPPPPPPPPPNPGQPMFAAPSPAGSTPFQASPYMAPPPPQRSGGCFKGCCIVGVILGVLGLVTAVGLGMNYKKLYAWSLIKTAVEPSDMRQDEKDEASALIRAYVDLVYGQKLKDAKYLVEFNKNAQDLQLAASDGKVEAREVRPVFARIKKILKDEGQSWPSSLFAASGSFGVRIVSFDAARRKEVFDYLRSKNLTDMNANFNLDHLPSDVFGNLSESEAEAIGSELEAKGATVEIKASAESTH